MYALSLEAHKTFLIYKNAFKKPLNIFKFIPPSNHFVLHYKTQFCIREHICILTSAYFICQTIFYILKWMRN